MQIYIIGSIHSLDFATSTPFSDLQHLDQHILTYAPIITISLAINQSCVIDICVETAESTNNIHDFSIGNLSLKYNRYNNALDNRSKFLVNGFCAVQVTSLTQYWPTSGAIISNNIVQIGDPLKAT